MESNSNRKRDRKKLLRFLMAFMAFGILFYLHYCRERNE